MPADPVPISVPGIVLGPRFSPGWSQEAAAAPPASLLILTDSNAAAVLPPAPPVSGCPEMDA